MLGFVALGFRLLRAAFSRSLAAVIDCSPRSASPRRSSATINTAAVARAGRHERAMTADPPGDSDRKRLLSGRDRLIGQVGFDVGRERHCRAIAIAHPAGHRLEANRLERTWDRGVDFSRLAEILLLNADQQTAEIVPDERRLAGQERVKRRPRL